MNILIIIILLVLLASQREKENGGTGGGTGGGNGGGGTPPPETCSDSKFARMLAYIQGLKMLGYKSYIDLFRRSPTLHAILQREYGDCRGWNNW
tara:strand:- start:80 stop:361 length:282 start_codon:yes stop_codon:yes gene_type:complete